MCINEADVVSADGAEVEGLQMALRSSVYK